MLSVEGDPFGPDRGDLEKQGRVLLDDLRTGLKSPFSAGNKRYNKTVNHYEAVTELVEMWPKDKSAITRWSSFVGRRITQAAIFYPLLVDSGYNPRRDFLAVSLRLRVHDPQLADTIGQVQVFRFDGKGNYDFAIFNQGVFASFTFNDVQSGLKVSLANQALVISRQAAQDNVTGRLSKQGNTILLTRDNPEMTTCVALPFRFHLGVLGDLMLGDNPDNLRNHYILEYTRMPKKARRTAFDERLLTHHPAGRILLEICQANSWQPTDSDVVRLVKLRQEVRDGRRSEVALNPNRLGFARWLVKHSRISENPASE